MKPFLTSDTSDFTQRMAERRERRGEKACVWHVLSCYLLNINLFCCCLFFFLQKKKICVKDVDVWWKVFSNKIIVTLSKQSLRSSFLSRPVAFVHQKLIISILGSSRTLVLEHPDWEISTLLLLLSSLSQAKWYSRFGQCYQFTG